MWQGHIGGSNKDSISSITIDQNSNIYLLGTFTDSIDADPGMGTFYLKTANSNVNGIFMIKLNSNGQFIWAKQLSNKFPSKACNIKAHKDSFLVVTSAFQDTIDLDPNSSTFYGLSQAQYDLFILKYDQSAQLLWSRQTAGIVWVTPDDEQAAWKEDDGGRRT